MHRTLSWRPTAPVRPASPGVAAGAPRVLAALLALTLCATFALAQTRPVNNTNDTLQKLRQATADTPLMWNVQLVLDGYISHMTRVYNLTEAQEQYTRELLTQRVKQFLKDYEKETRTLFGEWYEYQMKAQMPTPDAARDFARRVQPLLSIIRQEIVDGNMKWREILNDDQKKQHDLDLKALTREFDRYDGMFQRWAEGHVTPQDLHIRTQQPSTIKTEDAMTLYVAGFVTRYNLDKSQQATAQSILSEAKKEAAMYREAHKADFEDIATQERAINSSSPKDANEATRFQNERIKLTRRRVELEKPLNDEIFRKLKARLEDVPTADQRAAQRARQESIMARVQRTQSRPAPASQPTATAPPATSSSSPASP